MTVRVAAGKYPHRLLPFGRRPAERLEREIVERQVDRRPEHGARAVEGQDTIAALEAERHRDPGEIARLDVRRGALGIALHLFT